MTSALLARKIVLVLCTIAVVFFSIGSPQAHAKYYREIDTEGDPGDGSDVEGSSGGTTQIVSAPNTGDVGLQTRPIFVEIESQYVDGRIVFVFTIRSDGRAK